LLNDIGINENLANSLFVDLELNKTELERLVKSNMDEKLNQILNNEIPDKFKENQNKNQSKSNNINMNNQTREINDNNISLNPEVQENKDSINSSTTNERDTKSGTNYNLSLSRYVELKSHFDVIRKLAYLPSINSLVSVSEVKKI
jgi:hypothetical protein